MLRAVIPNGFMAPSTTSLMLTLCEAGETMKVPFDLPGQSDAKHAPADACAVGTLAAHAILPQAALAAHAAYDAPRVAVRRCLRSGPR